MSISEHTFGETYAGAGGDTGPDATRREAPPRAADGSHAAARLLEITARETDQWRADARNEAAAVVADAREEAARLVAAARDEADRLVTSARDEATRTVDDARVEAYRVREETAAVRKSHDEDIAHLQQVAGEHRERLRQHLTEMLDRVDSAPGDSAR
jgi:vacuolar-type H+-ATPase subunit H